MLFKKRRLCRTGRDQRWQAITIPSVVTHMWSDVQEIELEYRDSDQGGYLIVRPVRCGAQQAQAGATAQAQASAMAKTELNQNQLR